MIAKQEGEDQSVKRELGDLYNNLHAYDTKLQALKTAFFLGRVRRKLARRLEQIQADWNSLVQHILLQEGLT